MIFMLCRFWGCIHGAIIFTFFQLHSCCSYFVTWAVCQGEGEREAAIDTALLRLWCDAFPSSLNSGVLSPKWSCANEKLLFWFKMVQILVHFFLFFLPFWLTWVLSQCGLDFSEHPESVPLSHGDAVAVAHMEVRCDRGFIGFILNGPFQQIGICDRGQNIMVPCVVTHNDRSLQDSPQDCQRILTVLLSLQWFRAYREEFRIFVAIATCIAAGFIM